MFMLRALLSCLVVEGLLAASSQAHAEEDLRAHSSESVSLDATHFLASTSGAAVADAGGVTAAWGGYDGAARAPVLSATAEIRVVRRLALVAGVSYGRASSADVGLRPQLGLRFQVLTQEASGVDASAIFLFRQDRFTSEDGLFQGGIALGRAFGDTSLVMNLVYGQDGEGDDHEGELRLAGLRRVSGRLHFGLEGHYMHAIASTDPHRGALGTPSSEAMVGPVATLTAGTWTLVLEAGAALRETARTEAGVAMLGGVGTAF